MSETVRPFGLLDVLVGVAERDAPGARQQSTDGGLAGAHRPDQHHPRPACGHRYLNESR